MDAREKRYFALNKKMMIFFGFWPTQTYRERILRYFIFIFALVLHLFLQLCHLSTLDFDLPSIIFAFQLVIPDVCLIAQYITAIVHYVTVLKLFSDVKRDWRQLRDADELKIMQKHVHQSELFMIVSGSLLLCFFGLLILPPVLQKFLSTNEATSSTGRFPVFHCIDYFLDPETFYYPIAIHQFLLFIPIIIIAVFCYSTYFWFIQHACARLSVVKLELNRPFINNDHHENVLAKPMDLSYWMIDIIKRMSRITEFVKLLNTLGERNYMLQIFLSFILVTIDFLCLLEMPALLSYEENNKNVLMFTVFIMTTLVPIYVSCYVGQKLIDYSEDVYKETCLVPIHEISLETQKLLLMTLTMNAKPHSISIGQIFVSSHALFSELLRTSLSFAMMLHSTQNV